MKQVSAEAKLELPANHYADPFPIGKSFFPKGIAMSSEYMAYVIRCVLREPFVDFVIIFCCGYKGHDETQGSQRDKQKAKITEIKKPG